MIARVLVPAAEGEGQRLEVPTDEAQHLVRVLRLGPEAAVAVFDGRGREWHAVIREVGRQRAVVELGRPRGSAPETRIRYALAIAVLKGDGTDEVVRDAVMLGVAEIRPVVSARTGIALATLTRGHRRERWERVAIASAKQCGRAVVPRVHEAVAVDALWSAGGEGPRLLLVEPGVTVSATPVAGLPAPASVSLAVGPEGGWTEQEVAGAVAAGWQPTALGQRVLRAAAAPLVALAACQAVWRDG